MSIFVREEKEVKLLLHIDDYVFGKIKLLVSSKTLFFFSEDIFEVDDFYLCAEEENVETEINASNGELSDFEGSSIEYLGVLDEKLHEKLIPKEDKKEKFNTLLKRK